ncbi:MAG TPA: hypothetical protein VGE45_05810 [Chloroflexia bacterium]
MYVALWAIFGVVADHEDVVRGKRPTGDKREPCGSRLRGLQLA